MSRRINLHGLFQLLYGINLSSMGCERCNANLLDAIFILLLFIKNRIKVYFNRIAQATEHLGIVLKYGGLLNAFLVLLGNKPVLAIAVFVDMFHLEVTEVETHPQVIRPQNVV